MKNERTPSKQDIQKEYLLKISVKQANEIKTVPPFIVSLNILRFHQILRPNEAFNTFLPFSPIDLTSCDC